MLSPRRAPLSYAPDRGRVAHTGKMRSWILTGTVALGMSVGSLPFTWDLLSSGLDVAKVQQRSAVSQGLVAFFMAYLNLVSRRLDYSSSNSELTGSRTTRRTSSSAAFTTARKSRS